MNIDSKEIGKVETPAAIRACYNLKTHLSSKGSSCDPSLDLGPPSTSPLGAGG